MADAELGMYSTETDFYERVEAAIGLPDDAGSLTNRIAGFESALIEAASRPDSETRLHAVVNTAKDIATKISNASDSIQNLRMQADQGIAWQVASLNDGLGRVADLNSQIRTFTASGKDVTGLMDQRQMQIDQISAIVPLREVAREHNQIALFTPGGALLLDSLPATVGFGPVGVIVPEMTMASSALSGLTINGVSVSTGANGPLAGGELAANFRVRDDLAVVVQERLDGVARDLVDRFQDTGLDPTLGPTEAGLFTDAGTAFSIVDEIGLSSRLMLNALVDPAQGGAAWRMRDGLGALVQGEQGNAGLLLSMIDVLSDTRVPASGGFSSAAKSAVGLSGDLLSLLHVEGEAASARMGFAAGQQHALKAAELQSGVDTDQEMQQLLLIERAYAANARVVTTVDEMIQTLLRM